ncbi:4'-phosphopantetheinyl transferase superfamily protein [Streptomyces sp. NPDC051940]|uniref:4'-phosphopantetheinyl transferase family protein n=1 Tax=Streptomyces sp. NPDC051940 TaxID=3155675 RepID=UPI0034499ED0
MRLHLLRLTPGTPAPAGLGPLDERERARAARFLREADRVRYVVAHTALRRVLAGAVGRAPADLEFVREACPGCGGPHGRPALAGDGVPQFSLSHSGDLVLIALAAVAVGVDVERSASAAAVERVLPLLHPAEQAEIRGAERRRDAFTRVWVRKEAWLKGTGAGLGRGLATDHVGLTGRPPGWAFAEVPVPPGFGAAVAVRGDAVRLRVCGSP